MGTATNDVIDVMRTALSREEFANALGMRPSDLFVKKMFKIVDKDGDERISFQVRMEKLRNGGKSLFGLLILSLSRSFFPTTYQFPFSFQEFLDTVVLFSDVGRSDEKLRIIFDMCDTNENGLLDKSELQEMLVSLVEIAKTEKVLQEDVDKLIDSMFKTTGYDDAEVLRFRLMPR